MSEFWAMPLKFADEASAYHTQSKAENYLVQKVTSYDTKYSSLDRKLKGSGICHLRICHLRICHFDMKLF